jgi:hypothetical protein
LKLLTPSGLSRRSSFFHLDVHANAHFDNQLVMVPKAELAQGFAGSDYRAKVKDIDVCF